MADNLTQLNVHVLDDVIKTVEQLRGRYGWSKRDLVMTAIRSLAQVMDAHERYAEQHDEDIADLYMRLAAEMPAGLPGHPEGHNPGRPGGGDAGGDDR